MREKVKTTELYMCGVDWQHEIGDSGDVQVFESLEMLKRHYRCVATCGAVRVSAVLTEIDWPIPQVPFSSVGIEQVDEITFGIADEIELDDLKEQHAALGLKISELTIRKWNTLSREKKG